jgi:peroxiredoxin
MLRETSRRFILELDEPAPVPRDRLLLKHTSQQGFSLYELSALRPTLTVFLRHAGCPFCREALEDLSTLRPAIERRGVGLAFVHMSSEPEAEKFFAEYGLADVPRFSDPSGGLYRAFALRRAEWREILGPRVWTRGFRAALLKGHGLGLPEGDALRMPGVFLLSEGTVVAQHRHASPAERPDYLDLLADLPTRLSA